MNGNGKGVKHNAPIEMKPGKICPLMSGQVVPMSPGGGKIATPNQVQMAPVMVPCQKEGCQWWDEAAETCIVAGYVHSLVDRSKIRDLQIAEMVEFLREATQRLVPDGNEKVEDERDC